MDIDPLTGLQDLTALARRFTPEAPPATAIWIDVDGLIWFNDSEGHEAGDAALAAIGRWIRDECKSNGLEGYRVGGEEFVLVRPAGEDPLDEAEAAEIADRVVGGSASLGLRFTGPRHAANDRALLTVSAMVFVADHRLAQERRAVCGELAEAIYAAGLAADLLYQRRGSMKSASGLAWAIQIVAQRGHGQDRAEVIAAAGGAVIVVADGAGGTGNGGVAAQAVVDAVRAASPTASWEEVLERCDQDHAALGGGQTTAVVVSIRGEEVHGASVGDSGAWIVEGGGIRDLTRHQERKPLVGAGGVPAYFRDTLRAGETLVVATDGLLRYATRADIARIAGESDIKAAARALVERVRLGNGELQDDVAVVLCRQRAGAR